MSVDVVGPEPGKAPFADASPAQIRSALTLTDATTFDQQWQATMQRAAENLDLTEVHEILQTWRQVAWLTTAHGTRTYQDTLTAAEQRLRTGERADGAVPWPQLKAELGLTDGPATDQ